MLSVRKGLFLFAIALSVAFAQSAIADGHAGAGAIKYRQAVMKAVGGHMGAMATILGGAGGNMADFKGHAHAMAELAKIAQNVFPEGSDEMAGNTGAKAEIWDNPAEFKKVLTAFQTNANALAKAAESGDKGQIGAAMGALGKGSCKACHEGFRVKK